MSDRKVVNSILWTNGMVMSFDQNGEQFPEYQGRMEDVWDKVHKDFPDAKFSRHDWSSEVKPYLPFPHQEVRQ